MQTYTQTYLDDHERWLLRRCAGINIEAKDRDGREYLVGSYLNSMAEQRHNGVKQYETALYLIAQACLVLDPMADTAYWEKLGAPHAELLAVERNRQVDDLLKVADVCAFGLSLTSQPDPYDDEVGNG